MSILSALAIACSFLTVLPAPRAEWTPSRLRYVPLAVPAVGLVVGALGACLFSALRFTELSRMFSAVVMALFYLALTGGLHMDGLMDTCDAVFSRKERKELKKKLEILSDPRVGAFAVMGCVSLLMLKAGIFYELFSCAPSAACLVMLAAVPVYSRLGLGLLFFLPFAKEDGLARTLGASRVLRDRFFLWAAYALFGALTAAAARTTGLKSLSVPLIGVISFVFYARRCVKMFGGVTGDLMGAYVELSETLMLLSLALARP